MRTVFLGVDAIIHLAGATIAKRWTNKQKQAIIESRILSSNVLFKAVKENPNQITQIVFGFGHWDLPRQPFGGLYRDQHSSRSRPFLAHVVLKWEESVDKFKTAQYQSLQNSGPRRCLPKKAGAFTCDGQTNKNGLRRGFVATVSKSSPGFTCTIWHACIFFAVQNGWEGIYNAASPKPNKQCCAKPK